MGISVSTCEISEEHLQLLETDPQDLDPSKQIIVHQYGPMDLKDPTKRVLAAQAIYKLMLHCADKAVRDRQARQKAREERSKGR